MIFASALFNKLMSRFSLLLTFKALRISVLLAPTFRFALKVIRKQESFKQHGSRYCEKVLLRRSYLLNSEIKNVLYSLFLLVCSFRNMQ
jgi:hypothetical protein